MKNLVRLLFILLLSAAFLYNAVAQEKQTPTTTTVSSADFNALLSKAPGQKVTLQLASGISFEGEVISNEQKFDNLHVGIARSLTNPNVLLQYHQRIREDKSVVYGGKLIAEGHIYFLQSQSEGRMTVQAKPMHEMIQDCSLH
jgi:hypothetical protein